MARVFWAIKCPQDNKYYYGNGAFVPMGEYATGIAEFDSQFQAQVAADRLNDLGYCYGQCRVERITAGF